MKKHYFIILYLINISVLNPVQVWSQDKQNGMNRFKEYVSKQSNDSSKSLTGQLAIKLDSVSLEQNNFHISLYKYYNESLVNRKKAFNWSHTSTIIIFWMVLIIVFLGLIFSAIQFYISMIAARHKSSINNQNISDADKTSSTNLKISMSGIEVNSSVLGVIILVISLVFFYLYLVHVYPVKEFNIDNKTIQEELIKEVNK